MKVFAEKFRGFSFIEIDLDKLLFLVGDNSSGKSSILHLVSAVCSGDLMQAPRLDDDFGVAPFDYFSPYFNRAPVTFGFSDEKNDYNFFKIITVEQGNINLPSITRCSYFTKDLSITFRRTHSKNYYKIRKHTSPISRDVALQLHKEGSGFKVHDAPLQYTIGQFPHLYSIDPDDSARESYSQLKHEVTSTFLPDTRLVSPTRALPEQFYAYRRKFNPLGKHFASMWMDFATESDDPTIKDIENFGKSSQLFEKLKVKKVSTKMAESPLLVSVIKSGKEFFINQVGVGVSQVIPVLIETLFSLSGERTPVLIQQPELHLHPRAQAELGSYFYASAKRGLRGVLETHSLHLLDRFRAETRDNRELAAPPLQEDGQGASYFDHNDVQILFCRNQETGNSVDIISIDRNGLLIGDPEDYHSFFIDETIRTMF